MTEEEFIDSIDCLFPYEDDSKSLELIHQARSISDNAVFMVLHEIVRAPKEVNCETIKRLYGWWLKDFSHKLLSPISEAAKAMIEGKELSVERVLELMKHLEYENKMYNALNILYCSCDDFEGKVERMHNQIVAKWENA